MSDFVFFIDCSTQSYNSDNKYHYSKKTGSNPYRLMRNDNARHVRSEILFYKFVTFSSHTCVNLKNIHSLSNISNHCFQVVRQFVIQ